MRIKKTRPIILAEDVPVIFDDKCIAELAKIARLPPGADAAAFAAGIREAARIFARDASMPTGNELHDEIDELFKAADRRSYNEVADVLERLSPQARDILENRGARPSIGIEVPSPDLLRDPARREEACKGIARLCQFGGHFIEGRRRHSGKRSRPVWRPLINAPAKQRNFPRRKAERDFVMWLSVAWSEATGSEPSRTARWYEATRGTRPPQLGPFARFVRKCLCLVGAAHADVVELMTEVHRRRRAMKQREGLSGINP